MKTRSAKHSDIPSLCNLLRILFSQEEEFLVDQGLQKQGLTKIIEDAERGIILVLEKDEAIVGMVNLLFTISTFTGGKVAILEDMVILPDCRGGGTGSFLLQAAIEKATQLGCSRITLLTDMSNVRAQAFYQRSGFHKSTMLPMRINLPNKG